MSITIAQTYLTDEKSKNQHAEETGYDYNKQVQILMGVLVENNIKMDILSGRPSSTIIPSVGTTNGVVVTEEDRNAYIAAHPQNAAPRSKRQEIAELLESGGSTLDDIPDQQEVNEAKLDVNLHKRFPPISEFPTHYAVIETPGYSTPKEEKKNIYRIIDASERLTLIDQFQGTNGDFYFVKSEDPSYKPFYIPSTMVRQLSDSARLAPFDLTVPGAEPTGGVPQDWIFLEAGKVYDSPETAEKRFVVAFDRETLPDNERAQILEQGFREGITEILKANNKNHSEEYIQNQLVQNQYLDKPAQAVEVFLSERDGLGVRVLVKIPIANLVMLEDAPPELAWQFTEDYRTETLEVMLGLLEKKIHSVGDKIDKYNGRVTIFNSFKEAKKVENLLPDIDSLAKLNGLEEGISKRKGLVQFYWNSEMKPVIVEFQPDDEEKKYNLEKGLQEFTQKFSIISKRTQGLLLSLEDIVEELDSPWEDFLFDWVRHDEITITPNGEEAKETGEREGPPVKTPEEKEKEDNFYNNSDRATKIHKKRSKESEPAGSPFVEPEVYERVLDQLGNGTEALYESFLNNVDFRKIMLDATSCLLSGVDISSFNKLQNDYGVLKKEHDRIKKDWEESKTADFLYPDDLPTDDISDAFFKTLGQTLGSMITNMISSMVKNVINSLVSACPDKKNIINTPANIVPDFPFGELQSMIDDLFGSGKIDAGLIKSILDDLANLLSPSELCDLLRGNPDPTTLRIVKALLQNSYCELGLDTREEIINFFISISSRMDLSICDEVDDLAEFISDDFLCPPSSSLRERLLADKEMSQEEIKNQMERERDRSRKMVEQFLEDMNEGIASGKFKAPNMFCSKDSEGNTVAGQTSFMDDQFKYVLETTVVSLFKPAYNSFSEEGGRFVQSLYVEKEDKTSNPNIKNPFTGEPLPEKMNSVSKKEPVPQLVQFYKKPVIKDEGATVFERVMSRTKPENAFSIAIPTNAEGTLAETRKIANINNPNPNPESTSCGEGSSEDSIDSILQNISVGLQQNRGVEKVIFKEVSPCVLVQNEIDKNTFKVLEVETSTPSSPPPQQEAQLSTNSCGDELVTISPPVGSFSRVSQPEVSIAPSATDEINQSMSQDVQVGETRTIVGPGAPSLKGCEDKREIGYVIQIGEEEYFSKQVIEDSEVKYLKDKNGAEAKLDSSSFFAAILQEAYSELSIDAEERRQIQGIVQNESLNLLKEVRGKVLNSVFDTLSNSKYLDPLGDASTGIRYILDYINLGPIQTSECDPHLLKIQQVVKELLENFQEELCLDLEQPEEDGRPRMTPLEKEIMKACIKITIRHYIIETLSTGIVSMTTFQGRNSTLEGFKANYISNRIEKNLRAYSDGYYNEFLSQAESIYEGMGKGSELISKLIVLEFTHISEGFYDALLMKERQITTRNKIIRNIPEISRFAVDGGTGVALLNGSSADFKNKDAFVYEIVYDENGKEEKKIFSLVLEEIGDLTRFNRCKFPDNGLRYILPLSDVTGKKYDSLKDMLFKLCFPIEKYESAITIHEMATTSRMFEVVISFGETRDNLLSSFYAALPEKDDWKKEDASLAAVGGSSGLTKVWDYNNGIYDVPCTDFSFNFGMDVCWGNSFKGLSFATALRMARDAALLEFKKYVERNDPAVKLASRLSFLSKLACVNIPTSAIAAAININPVTALIMPLTPSAAIYHALGLGIFLPNQAVNSDSDEGKKARDEITSAKLKLPPHCGTQLDDTERSERQQQEMEQQRQQQRQQDLESIQNELQRVEEDILHYEERERFNRMYQNQDERFAYEHAVGKLEELAQKRSELHARLSALQSN